MSERPLTRGVLVDRFEVIKCGMEIKASIDQSAHYRDKKQTVAVVDVNDEENLNKWAEVLHLTREEILSAVKLFGPKVSDIRRGLSKTNAA